MDKKYVKDASQTYVSKYSIEKEKLPITALK